MSEEYKSQHSVEFLAQHLAQLRETKPNVEKSLDVAIIATGPFAPKSIIDTKDGRGVGILVGHWPNINYFAFQKGGKKALPDLSRICSTLGESFCKCLSLGEAREKLKYYISKLGLRRDSGSSPDSGIFFCFLRPRACVRAPARVWGPWGLCARAARVWGLWGVVCLWGLG